MHGNVVKSFKKRARAEFAAVTNADIIPHLVVELWKLAAEFRGQRELSPTTTAAHRIAFAAFRDLPPENRRMAREVWQKTVSQEWKDSFPEIGRAHV